jgi:ATP-dependent DNA helicase PIF1
VDELNYEQKVCFDAAMTGQNVFISGPGGVGKSFVLRAITEEFKLRNRRYRVTASTGVAALNVGGVTIHSMLSTGICGSISQVQPLLGTKPFHRAMERLQWVETIIVDEVSMLSGDYIQMLDFWLKQVRSSTVPFGGCQMIFCGDFLQLPPVEKREEKAQYQYAFQSPAWKEGNFKEVDMHFSWRQEDQTFVNALNIVRFGKYPKDVRKLLRPCIGRELDMPTHLVCTNKEADEINFARLLAHEGTEYTAKPLFSIEKNYIKSRPEWASELKAKMAKDSLTDNPLRIKVGVPVLLLKNHVELLYVNGTRGIVDSVKLFEHGEIDSISVKLADGSVIEVRKEEYIKFNGDAEVEAKMRHFPMRLGWALTIHKSQGLTLDNVEIDLGRGFAYGQAYVALSRMKSLEGLALTDAINPSIVKADPELVDFYDKIVIKRGGDIR